MTYHVALAHASGLANACVDLVAVAQALHWFDLEAFYREVRRVAHPGAAIAAWTYGSCRVTPELDKSLADFELGTVGPYWPANRRFVDEGYRTIPFPFDEIPMPSFELSVNWTLGQLGGYLRSWSAVARYLRARGEDPVAPLLEQLENRWGGVSRTRKVVWPLTLRLGRIG